jgi:hypothetical protein
VHVFSLLQCADATDSEDVLLCGLKHSEQQLVDLSTCIFVNHILSQHQKHNMNTQSKNMTGKTCCRSWTHRIPMYSQHQKHNMNTIMIIECQCTLTISKAQIEYYNASKSSKVRI